MHIHGNADHNNVICPSVGRDREPDSVEYADYVVVGAGTGGAPLIRQLAEAGYSVYAIEAGANRNADPNVLNPGLFFLDQFPQYHIYYQRDPGLLSGPAIAAQYYNGLMWGGSHGHNYMQMVRGTPCLYDEWAEIAGDDEWRYEKLRPIMIGAETFTPRTGEINPDERGTCGPIFVTETTTSLGAADPFIQAVAVPFSNDYNDWTRGVFVVGPDQRYYTPTTPPERSWTGKSYLGEDVVEVLPDGDGEGRGGLDLHIASNSVAMRILFDDEVGRTASFGPPRHDPDAHDKLRRSTESGGRGDPSLTARGVRFVRADGTVHDALARVKVILASGSIEDPALLQRSGIGPCELLKTLGVKARVINENVGRNGQNHVGIVGFFPAKPGQAAGVLQSFHAGPNSEQDGCREYQFIWVVNDPSIAFSALFPPQSVIGVGLLLRPARNVEVDAVSDDPADRAVIRGNYLVDPEDQQRQIELAKILGRTSIRYSGALPVSPPAAVFPNDAEFGPYGGLGTDATLFQWAQTNGIESIHISGTARMSSSDCDGVVDGNLDVYGVDNLGIVSNTVVNSIEDGNTAWSSIVTGLEKARIEGATVAENNAACRHEHKTRGCRSCDDHHRGGQRSGGGHSH